MPRSMRGQSFIARGYSSVYNGKFIFIIILPFASPFDEHLNVMINISIFSCRTVFGVPFLLYVRCEQDNLAF